MQVKPLSERLADAAMDLADTYRAAMADGQICAIEHEVLGRKIEGIAHQSDMLDVQVKGSVSLLRNGNCKRFRAMLADMAPSS